MNETPIEMIQAYVTAFETLEPVAVAAFYHLPSLFMSSGGVVLISDSAGAQGLASVLIEQARAQGYRRSEILNLEIKTLAETLATTSGVFVRFNSKAEEISRFGFAYTLRRESRGWKIVTAIAHDAPSAQGFAVREQQS